MVGLFLFRGHILLKKNSRWEIMRILYLLIDKLGDLFMDVGCRFEDFAFQHLLALKKIDERLKDTRSVSSETHYTDFGYKRLDIIDKHQKIIEEEKDKEMIGPWVRDVVNDYDALISEYNGLLPLEYSDKMIPNEEWAKEGKEIEVNILHSFPVQCSREEIGRWMIDAIKHIQESYYPDTPIWVEITQHKEKENK